MCKTATRLSADRLAAESPRVIHQSRVTMSHLCRGTILKRPGGAGGAQRESASSLLTKATQHHMKAAEKKSRFGKIGTACVSLIAPLILKASQLL